MPTANLLFWPSGNCRNSGLQDIFTLMALRSVKYSLAAQIDRTEKAMAAHFDIFRIEVDGRMYWLGRAEDLEDAKARVKILSLNSTSPLRANHFRISSVFTR
jgi:hypothetical protein